MRLSQRICRPRSLASLAAALAVAAGLAVSQTPAGGADVPAPQVRIENFRFEPAEIVVTRGGTVTWLNRDEELHAVVAADGSFASPGIDTDARYSHEFDAPGRYEYRCALHPQMKGTVVVR
jgi:plastocyanin